MSRPGLAWPGHRGSTGLIRPTFVADQALGAHACTVVTRQRPRVRPDVRVLRCELFSNTARVQRVLRDDGVEAEPHVFEAMPHGRFFGAPEDREWDAELRRFLTRHIA